MFISARAACAQAPGSLLVTGKMNIDRDGYTATLLADGKVLVTGGYDTTGSFKRLASAEIYDPSTGTFALTGNMLTPRSGHTGTLLRDGKVLVAGGAQDDRFFFSAEVYDPSTGAFRRTGDMLAVGGRIAQLLGDGKVLNVGSWSQVYDPDTGSFTGRYIGWGDVFTVSTFLADGRVLFTGGGYRADAAIYDPGTGTLSPAGNLIMFNSRFGSDGGFYYHSTALLADGKVLITGGTNSDDFCCFSEAQIYDPSTGTFILTGSGGSADPTCGVGVAARLPGDMVLGVRCQPTGRTIVESILLYDPSIGQFIVGGDLPVGLGFRVVAVLSDGRVLMAGGPGTPCCAARPQSVELYFPPLRLVSRASRTTTLAPESLASLFGARMAPVSAVADPRSPATSLGGISVLVRDSAGVERLAPLALVSPKQIDFEVPPGTAAGSTTFEIVNGADSSLSVTAQVRDVAPGIFASPSNMAEAYAVRIEADGTQTLLSGGSPIILDDRPVLMYLSGSGIRSRSSLDNVRCTIGGISIPVEYAGPDGDVPGRDQVKVRLTAALQGNHDGRLILAVDGVRANIVLVDVR